MKSHRTLAGLITEALSECALTGFELARILEDRHGLTMRGREGSFYAALIELERKGYVQSTWDVIPEGGRRRRYFLPVLVGVGVPAPGGEDE